MSFTGRMINIQAKKNVNEIKEEIAKIGLGDPVALAYKLGHRDARHAAADIAIEVDWIFDEFRKCSDVALQLASHFPESTPNLTGTVSQNLTVLALTLAVFYEQLPDLLDEAFQAGYNAGANSETQIHVQSGFDYVRNAMRAVKEAARKALEVKY